MRVSKADGSQTVALQTVALQRDVLLAAGVDAAQLYEDHASGRNDDRPGLASCLKACLLDRAFLPHSQRAQDRSSGSTLGRVTRWGSSLRRGTLT